MIRDGVHLSLWQEKVKTYKPVFESVHSQKFDVIIVGGGITGIATALALQTRGKNCLVLETRNLCYGTTGGTTAHINTFLDTPYNTIIDNFNLEVARHIAKAAKDVIKKIKSTVDTFAIDCGYEDCKAFVFAQNEKQVDELDKILDACIKVGVHAAHSKDIPVPIAFLKAMVINDQGKFHPVNYVYGMAAAFEKAGGIILENCRLIKADESGELIKAETEMGNFQCDHLVYATHIPPGINLLHLRCTPYRSYAMVARLKSGQYPKDLIYDMADPYHYYRTQLIDGEEYFIAGGKDHKTGYEQETDACFESLEQTIRTHFDISSISHAWSSQYYESSDGIPYIGHLPSHNEKVLVATGFGGNGMTYSHIAAEVIQCIIFQEKNELIDIFSPSRLKPIAGFKNFVEHNFDVVKQLMSKALSLYEDKNFESIPPGEGKVLKIDNHPIGVYSDGVDSIHIVSAVCTHMKCIVKWNTAEKSWDCPCHGARYSIQGKVLNGPADHDLEYIHHSVKENV
ncbi:FAD-dependent oxidoreductase [Chryseotalea sanaruensis]|uniref:FAD-dependent oxidoreductase n=1 Tax=Chryseotalea sanaruensis TaxID=2482724 RepID=A0A401U6H8_9BACT|nr:FAD-dependent oxidoreductase [Chryseotalea sanaruensis]GCC50450.1 FAD-dependent oxidoreductase [Chryseotalea sanaruensis]